MDLILVPCYHVILQPAHMTRFLNISPQGILLGAADRIYTGVKRSFFIYFYVTFLFLFHGGTPQTP
jgi:hypothetical protein